MAKKMALGKGIASLLQDTPNQILKSSLSDLAEKKEASQNNKIDSASLGDGVRFLPVRDVTANPDQPRKIFKEEELCELAESIRENGIIQPIIVVEADNGNYEIVAGERRFRAAKKVGLDRVPVVIKRITKKEKMVFSIIENVQRDDLNCVEEALAYLQLISEFKLTQDEVAKKVGKSRSSIANLLRILKLPRVSIEMLQSNKLSLGHAKVLISLKDDVEKIILLSKKVAESNLSVRDLEKLIEFEKVRNTPRAEKNINDIDFEKKIQNLQDMLIDLTGRKLKIKTKGSNEKGSIEFKYNNTVEFNSLFEYLTLSSDKGHDSQSNEVH